MNTYSTSTGQRLTRSQIESRIRKAKANVINDQLINYGYNFCKWCGRSTGTYLDCAHTIPVSKCLNSGQAELAYDEENIQVLCRECHKKHDKL